MKTTVKIALLIGALLLAAIFVHGGVYEVRGTSIGLCYKVNRFTGTTYCIRGETESLVKPDPPPPLRFRTKESREIARDAFERGFSLDAIAKAQPLWSRDAIRNEYKAWQDENPDRNASAVPHPLFFGFKTEKCRNAVRKCFAAGQSVEDIAAAHPNWSPMAIGQEEELWNEEQQ